jgi:hypothetical protein
MRSPAPYEARTLERRQTAPLHRSQLYSAPEPEAVKTTVAGINMNTTGIRQTGAVKKRGNNAISKIDIKS